jgi:hypothetical protein
MVRKYYHRSIAKIDHQKSYGKIITLFYEWPWPSLYEHYYYFDFIGFKNNQASLIRVSQFKVVNFLFW